MHKPLNKSPYTSKEWEKIKKLASVKGKLYKTAKTAKKHIAEIASVVSSAVYS